MEFCGILRKNFGLRKIHAFVVSGYLLSAAILLIIAQRRANNFKYNAIRNESKR